MGIYWMDNFLLAKLPLQFHAALMECSILCFNFCKPLFNTSYPEFKFITVFFSQIGALKCLKNVIPFCLHLFYSYTREVRIAILIDRFVFRIAEIGRNLAHASVIARFPVYFQTQALRQEGISRNRNRYRESYSISSG